MGETQKKFNLRVAEDDKTVLLDCDISTDELEELVAAIGKELEALGIKDPPDQEQLREQLNCAAEKDPHLVNFILIEDKPPVPLLRITDDGIEVLLSCDIATENLDALVVSIREGLVDLGVKDPPDQKKLMEQLNSAAKKDPHLVDFVLIKGAPLVFPQDGKVEWEGNLFKTSFDKDPSTGKIDYREKGVHDSVVKGTLLGHQIPAVEGKDGLNVFGDTLLAEKPVTDYPTAGDNVRLDTNKNAYYAEINGRVLLFNNVLSVNEKYIVEEDVDITTGNIAHTGTVVVNRDVLSGAKIEAEGNIEVHGTIENAEIRTKADLIAHGGIRQAEGHKIVAEGSIQAKFIDGGDIQAKKDIVIEKEIVNCHIRTLGAVIIPRGNIVGGEIIALKGIYAGYTGSKTYVPTMLVAGDDFSVRFKISMRKKKIERAERELKQLRNFATAQMADQKRDFTTSTEEHSRTLLRISELEQERKILIDEVKDIKAQTLSNGKRLVNVGVTIFPKTVISLGDEILTVEEETDGPVKAEIIEGEIKLSEGERSPDV
ncbi:MAG: FapA family protein [Candidatus Scalindua sp.]